MRRGVVLTGLACILIEPASTGAQPPRESSAHALVPCGDSPTPGIRPVDKNCAVLLRKEFDAVAQGPLVLRLETFASTDVALRAITATSAVVQAHGMVWLLTVAPKGERSQGGRFVTEIGPIPELPNASRYEMQISEADFGPDMNPVISKAIHTHSGPELWYLFSGEQCLETPNGTTRAHAGQGMLVPGNTPMQLNIVGSSKRDALFVIIHDATKPATTVSEWRPRGTCHP